MQQDIEACIGVVLGSYEAWLHRRAGQLLPHSHPDHDDLVQEGRIAMWRALEKADEGLGALPEWLTSHASWRMKDIVAKRGWLGMPPRRHGRTPLDAVQPEELYLSDLLGDTEGVVRMLAAAELPSAVELAYHQREIVAALRDLTPRQRQYVVMRFWYDYGLPVMREVFGYDPSGLWSSPKNGAKKKLRHRLAHLASAVA